MTSPLADARTIGQRIKAARLARGRVDSPIVIYRVRGWTQQQLADASGLSVVWIQKLEQGRASLPSAVSLYRIARALGVTVESLLAP